MRRRRLPRPRVRPHVYLPPFAYEEQPVCRRCHLPERNTHVHIPRIEQTTPEDRTMPRHGTPS